MKVPKINRDRLKVSRDVITFFLTIAIVFMAGFLGVLTGFHILVKPELEMTAYTVTSTSTTTTPAITSTTTTTVTTTSTTTIIMEPCSPCFEYFNYLGHNTNSLSLKNGPRTVKITKASQTKGGSMSPDFNMEYVSPNQLMIFLGNFPEGTQINIEYLDITSGDARLDSATLH
jgi:hypothetical protein